MAHQVLSTVPVQEVNLPKFLHLYLVTPLSQNMQTQAYFEDIQQHIIKELHEAKESIFVAIAWFTDPELFELLCDKAINGVKVNVLLLNHEMNNHEGYGLDFGKLGIAGGQVDLIGSDKEMMHNKFCVIDRSVVITGSYNWTRRARVNDENITITKNSEGLALDFITEFQRLKKKYLPNVPEADIDLNVVLKRLEIVKNTISLQDADDIAYQTGKIKKLFPPENNSPIFVEITQVLHHIDHKAYGVAVNLISSILTKFQTLVSWIDPEIAGLQLEIKALSLQLSSLEDEQSDIEKTIHTFEVRHTEVLGTIILKLLALRKLAAKRKAKENPDSQKAQQDYNDTQQEEETYKGSYNETINQPILPLTIEQEKDLKDKFRRISKLAHPDVVDKMFSEEATRLFIKAKEARDRNDLGTVQQILDYLENGKPLKLKFETLTQTEELRAEARRLRYLIEQLLVKITEVKKSETYQTITAITDWESYFAESRAKLQMELERLENTADK